MKDSSDISRRGQQYSIISLAQETITRDKEPKPIHNILPKQSRWKVD